MWRECELMSCQIKDYQGAPLRLTAALLHSPAPAFLEKPVREMERASSEGWREEREGWARRGEGWWRDGKIEMTQWKKEGKQEAESKLAVKKGEVVEEEEEVGGEGGW